MAVITFGGETIDATPAPHEPTEKEVVYLGDSLWDNMIAMQMYRHKAVEMWHRICALEHRISENPTAKNVEKARTRIDDLKAQIRIQQYQFLLQEQSAEDRWRRLTPANREEIDADTMFGVDADAESIYGCWERKLSSNDRPPVGCTIDQRLYKFIFPQHAYAYTQQYRWVMPDVLPESATRRRKK